MKAEYHTCMMEISFFLFTKTTKNMFEFSKLLFFDEECQLSYTNYNSLLARKKESFKNSSAIMAGEVWDKKREALVNGYIKLTWRRKKTILNDSFLDNVEWFFTKNSTEVKKFLAEDQSNHSALELYFFSAQHNDQIFSYILKNSLLQHLIEYKASFSMIHY